MPAHNVVIYIDRQERSTSPGANLGAHLASLVSLIPGDQLLFEVEGEIDVPVAADDVIFIRGGEKFSIGSAAAGAPDNPVRRVPWRFELNDKPFEHHAGMLQHGKITAAELKRAAGEENVDLWVDLDDFADVLVEDGSRIVLQNEDKFFTVKREHDDRFYDVTVLLDGEDHAMRFPIEFTVQEVIKRSLAPRDKPQVAEFSMVDRNVGTNPLPMSSTLQAAGVRDGHILSITRNNGGGGALK
jgi:urease accessory protein UreE